MTKAKLASTILATATLAILFLFVPADSDSATGTSLFGVEAACAQTGTCRVSPGDICFVNGQGFADREWDAPAK